METELICAVADNTIGPFNFIDLIYIIILLLLLFSSAAISGSEVAYFSLTPGQLEELRQKGYEKVCNLYKKPEKLLATILISNNFVNVGIVILSSYLVDSLFDFSFNPLLGFFIQVVVVTFVILLFGEIIPKLYANRSAMSMAIHMAAPLTFLGFLFRPISALFQGAGADKGLGNQ